MKGFSAILAFAGLLVLLALGAFIALVIAYVVANIFGIEEGGMAALMILSEIGYIVTIFRLANKYTKDKPDQY